MLESMSVTKLGVGSGVLVDKSACIGAGKVAGTGGADAGVIKRSLFEAWRVTESEALPLRLGELAALDNRLKMLAGAFSEIGVC